MSRLAFFRGKTFCLGAWGFYAEGPPDVAVSTKSHVVTGANNCGLRKYG